MPYGTKRKWGTFYASGLLLGGALDVHRQGDLIMEDNDSSAGVGTIMEGDREDDRGKDENSTAASAPPLPTEAHGRIGRHLRKVYGSMLAEPMPAKFGKLLDELAKSERSK